MGCCSSKATKYKENDNIGGSLPEQRKQSILESTFRPEPEIRITGDDVSFVPPPGIKVIFIYGGPGSGKGRIIANLRSMFGVRLISVESLIFHHLPKKVKHRRISSTLEMELLIENDPSHITLEWVLRLLQHQIDSDPNQIFVIDMIPNLKWLVQNEHLVKECSREMKHFEEKVPISFAVHLSLNENSLENTLDYSHHDSSNTTPPGTAITDDADNKRAKCRFKIHEESIAPFLDFFRSTNRLVTIDVSSGAVEPIWDKVHEFFTAHHLHAWRPVDCVLVFAFDGLEVGSLDMNNCGMQVVKLTEAFGDANDLELDELLDNLGHYIDLLADESHHFIIEPTGTKLMEKKFKEERRSLVFSDVCDSKGVRCCVNRISTKLNKLTQLDEPYFKAVCSSEDETLVFPVSIPDSFCQQIALCMAEKHPSKRLTTS